MGRRLPPVAAWAVAATIVAGGFVWATAAAGPLPGDVALTRAIQRAFGDEPAWADWLTSTAKFPAAWATFAVAAALAAMLGGWRAGLACAASFAAALGADKLLRLAIAAPRPDPDLVAVAAPMSSSGLPSTFGLVYGALFGLVLLLALAGRGGRSTAIGVLAAMALVAGLAARVAPGGHWPSQMLLSYALAILIAAALLMLSRRLGAPARRD